MAGPTTPDAYSRQSPASRHDSSAPARLHKVQQYRPSHRSARSCGLPRRDDVHHFGHVRFRAALVDDRQLSIIETLGQGARRTTPPTSGETTSGRDTSAADVAQQIGDAYTLSTGTSKNPGLVGVQIHVNTRCAPTLQIMSAITLAVIGTRAERGDDPGAHNRNTGSPS